MGTIEISDGVSNRHIPVGSLTGHIRIELAATGGPRVIVPEGVGVERLQPAP